MITTSAQHSNNIERKLYQFKIMFSDDMMLILLAPKAATTPCVLDQPKRG